MMLRGNHTGYQASRLSLISANWVSRSSCLGVPPARACGTNRLQVLELEAVEEKTRWLSVCAVPENDQEIFQSYGTHTCSVTVQRFFNMNKNEIGENTLQ